MKVNYFLNLVIFTSFIALCSTLQAMEDSELGGLNSSQRIHEQAEYDVSAESPKTVLDYLRPDSHGRMRGEQGYGSPYPDPARGTLPDIFGREPGMPNYGWPKPDPAPGETLDNFGRRPGQANFGNPYPDPITDQFGRVPGQPGYGSAEPPKTVLDHLRPDSYGRMRGEQGYGSPSPYPAPGTLPDIFGRDPGTPNYGWPNED